MRELTQRKSSTVCAYGRIDLGTDIRGDMYIQRSVLRSGLFLLLFLATVVHTQAQDVFIYGIIKALPDKLPIEQAEITILDETGMPMDATTSGDSGYYQFGLSLDRVYRIEYTANGAIPKALIFDLRNVNTSSEDIEGGWGMNVDVTLYPEIDAVPDSLIAIPFGISSWSAADTMFQWDMRHTQRVRNAWAPWIERIAEARIPRPEKTWDRRSSMIILLAVLMMAWRVYLSDRFDAWVASTPTPPRLSLFLWPILLLGMLGWAGWNSPGWLGWWAGTAVMLAICGLVWMISKRAYFFGRREVGEETIAQEDRERSQRILNRMRLILGIPAVLCVFGLFSAWNLTLVPERYFLRHAAIGIALVVGVGLVLGGAIKRTFAHRDDRVTFWSLALLFALILVPGIVHFADKEFASPSSTRLAEITGLFESTGRRGRMTYEAHVLVDGRARELRLRKEVWEEASDLDALDLRIGSGPFGIEHILEWHLVRRSQSDAPDAAQAD